MILIAAIGLRNAHPSETELVGFADFMATQDITRLATGSDAAAIQQHLTGCTVCQSFVDRWLQTRQVIQAAAPPTLDLSPEAEARFDQAIREEI